MTHRWSSIRMLMLVCGLAHAEFCRPVVYRRGFRRNQYVRALQDRRQVIDIYEVRVYQNPAVASGTKIESRCIGCLHRLESSWSRKGRSPRWRRGGIRKSRQRKQRYKRVGFPDVFSCGPYHNRLSRLRNSSPRDARSPSVLLGRGIGCRRRCIKVVSMDIANG